MALALEAREMCERELPGLFAASDDGDAGAVSPPGTSTSDLRRRLWLPLLARAVLAQGDALARTGTAALRCGTAVGHPV